MGGEGSVHSWIICLLCTVCELNSAVHLLYFAKACLNLLHHAQICDWSVHGVICFVCLFKDTSYNLFFKLKIFKWFFLVVKVLFLFNRPSLTKAKLCIIMIFFLFEFLTKQSYYPKHHLKLFTLGYLGS